MITTLDDINVVTNCMGVAFYIPIINSYAMYWEDIEGLIALSSNTSFTEWSILVYDEVFATALLDRLLHYAEVMTNTFYLQTYKLSNNWLVGLFHSSQERVESLTLTHIRVIHSIWKRDTIPSFKHARSAFGAYNVFSSFGRRVSAMRYNG